MDAQRDQWMRRTGPFFPLVLAFRGHSDLPVAEDVTPTEEEAQRFPSYLVLIGILHGLALALLALLLLETNLVPAIAACLLVAVHVFVTGARGERGVVAAVAPKLGGSGVGSGHILAVVLLRIAVLAGMSPDAWPSALLAMVVVPKVVHLLAQARTLQFFSTARSDSDDVTGLRPLLLLACLLAVLLVAIGAWGLVVFILAAVGGLVVRARHLSDAAAAAIGEILLLLLIASLAPAVVSPFVVAP